MKFLILASFVVVATAKPQGYNTGAPSRPFNPSAGVASSNSGLGTGGGLGIGFSSGFDLRSENLQQPQQQQLPNLQDLQRNDDQVLSSGGSLNGGFLSNGNQGNHQAPVELGQSCGEDEVRHVDGSCVRPIINRRIFVYAAPPAQRIETLAPKSLPQPKVDYNFVFVRTQQQVQGAQPVVLPPPQQKTLVYVLNEKSGALEQEVIELPANPTQPEVYFVNYDQGDNPKLPGGIDLREALAQSAQQGEVIDGASNQELNPGNLGDGHGSGDGQLQISGGFDGTVAGTGDGFGGAVGGAEGGFVEAVGGVGGVFGGAVEGAGGGFGGAVGGAGGGFGGVVGGAGGEFGGVVGGAGGRVGGAVGGEFGGAAGGGFGGAIRNDYSAPLHRQSQPLPPSTAYSRP
ncbi:Cuticle Protein Tweedle [Hyalella azteca]|uniref:Cuticle Protein Tweedle n=1 Tax=Hyalella azteca TaxID=294128 RepID=A0A6A0HAL6_HYAAZ|nr:keratin, type I cytoskeletal 9 [Hyalella azteca]KAA0202752.1 Cuticle Protein Tweedle [Hyalella azteca]